jgi:hypothetical protein
VNKPLAQQNGPKRVQQKKHEEFNQIREQLPFRDQRGEHQRINSIMSLPSFGHTSHGGVTDRMDFYEAQETKQLLISEIDATSGKMAF